MSSYTEEQRLAITNIILTSMLKLIDGDISWCYYSGTQKYGINYLGIGLASITYDELISEKSKTLEHLPQQYKKVADQLDPFRRPITGLDDPNLIPTLTVNNINRMFNKNNIQLNFDANDKGTVQYFIKNQFEPITA